MTFKKKNKPELESKEEPVINYGKPDPAVPAPLKELQLRKQIAEEDKAEPFVFNNSELSKEEDLQLEIAELEGSLAMAKDSFNKLFKKYQELTVSYTQLKEEYKTVTSQVNVNPNLVEYDQLKSTLGVMFQEFQNEASGKNLSRQVHDIIYLTGEHGLINKFRRSFPFLK